MASADQLDDFLAAGQCVTTVVPPATPLVATRDSYPEPRRRPGSSARKRPELSGAFYVYARDATSYCRCRLGADRSPHGI
jgi:hypothetical protein